MYRVYRGSFRQTEARTFPLKVQMGKNVGFDVRKGDFDYPHVEVTYGLLAAEMAVTPLNVYPPRGVRPLVAHFEGVNANEVAMTFFGDTLRHRDAFIAAGLIMSTEEQEDSSTGETIETEQCADAKHLETFCHERKSVTKRRPRS